MKINLISAVLALIFGISCSSSPVRFSRIEYKVAEYIKVNPDDLKSALSDIKTDSSSSIHIAVILYSYSSGAETISFSGDNDFKTAMAKGKIKGLVKVMKGKDILKAEFVEGGGTTREEMILALVKDIKLKLTE